MSTTTEISSNRSAFLTALQSAFVEKANALDAQKCQPKDEQEMPYYHKWVSTQVIASRLGVSPAVARRYLTELESKELVVSQRSPNYIRWAAKEVPGFIQHPLKRYSDYLCRK